MAIGNITYKDLSDSVVGWVKSACQNIPNCNSLNDYVKNGSNYTVYTESHPDHTGEVAVATISSPNLKNVSEQDVETDMNNFLIAIGVGNIKDNYISQDCFYDFINDMVCFCCTKVCFVASQTSNDANSNVQYVVYNKDNNNYQNKIVINDSGATSCEIIAEDTKNILDYVVYLFTMQVNTSRVLPCHYNYTITFTAN